MAICGGVNLILYPGATICLSKAKMGSTTGLCQAFSDKADGYVRGEGCGVVILKSAEQVRKYSIIRSCYLVVAIPFTGP